MIKFSLIWCEGAKIKLWMPEYFRMAPRREIALAIGRGGCGPGHIGDKLVPDKIYGLNVRSACKRHDMAWYLAETPEDRVLSDCMFLCNLLLLNDKYSNWFTRLWRLKALGCIYHYFEAVAYLGFKPEGVNYA